MVIIKFAELGVKVDCAVTVTYCHRQKHWMHAPSHKVPKKVSNLLHVVHFDTQLGKCVYNID